MSLSPASEAPTLRLLVDAMLGNLARDLRLLGYDAAFAGRRSDGEVLRAAQREGRVLVTRDRRLAARARGLTVLLVAEADPKRQALEVLRSLGLRPHPADALTRCLACNGRLAQIGPDDAFPAVPDHVAAAAPSFLRCSGCGRTYWPGSHLTRLQARVAELVGALEGA